MGTLWGGGGDREVLKELLHRWQLSRKKRERGALLPWPTTAASPQITMEIHISDWTHKFQNKTGLDAKANSELYKSKWVNSVPCSVMYYLNENACKCIFPKFYSIL